MLAGLLGFLCPVAAIGGGGDYLIDVWDTENGLPNSSVTAITQTPDGYLWIGTYNGLERFDGVRFVTHDPVNTPALGHARIQDLFLDVRGALWINTFDGSLSSLRDGAFAMERKATSDLRTSLVVSDRDQNVFLAQSGELLRRGNGARTPEDWQLLGVGSPGDGRLSACCRDKSGVFWCLTRDGVLGRLAGDRFESLPEKSRPPGQRTMVLTTDAAGRVWVGTDNAIAVWNGDRFENMTPTNGETAFETYMILPTRDGSNWVLANGRLRKQSGRRWVDEAVEWQGLLGRASGRDMGAHEDQSGGIWFNHYGNGLFHIRPDGVRRRITLRDGLPGDRIGCWFQDREGNVWAGVDRGGLVRLREKRFQVVGTDDGLQARAVTSICEDASGAMWFGTYGGGLSRWKDGMVTHYAVGPDGSPGFIFSVYPRDNGLWFSGENEDLSSFENGQVHPSLWPVHGVKTMFSDRNGRLWLGIRRGLVYWLPGANRGVSLRTEIKEVGVRALAEDSRGAIWIGAEDGALYRFFENKLKSFRPTDALAGQPVWSVLADEDGTVWVGTFRGGLLRFKDGTFTRYTTREGLPDDVIAQILDDGEGQLWMGSHQGIFRISKSTLDRLARSGSGRMECVCYGRLDGLPTLECSGSYQPACWRARDGRLWFSTVKGAVSVLPRTVSVNQLVPPVHIEDLRMDGVSQPVRGEHIEAPPGRRQFEFRYTALSYTAPDKVRFRHRLDGVDQDWVESGTRRVSTYGYLRPGKYAFHVIACNNDGVWNEEGATLGLTVLPYFWETWWFWTLVWLGVVGAVAGTVRHFVTRQMRRDMVRLEQQHAIERDRARIAKDIHDELGAGLTQITLASELARRGPAAETQRCLGQILESARSLTRAMDETVWAVDPRNDTLDGLMTYICKYALDYMRVAGIRCRLDVPSELPSVPVNSETRHNLFLSVKEALNNVIKHARATEVWLRLQVRPEGFTLVIEDNGQGLPDPGMQKQQEDSGQRISSGRGLNNFNTRLESIGGKFTLSSRPGQGTRVEFSVRLPGHSADGNHP
jgi:signal transduction histidine kinase/ligand-binding sensor domain-containing protein